MSVDPSALAFPSSAQDLEPGPSRKRARTDLSTEERKEARAHRNRIAAQNSRDRRKAQFTYLEHRVAELEEENRQLRAGMGLSSNLPVSTPSRLAEEEKDRQRQRAQERENHDLKERIRTLEKGWDAVMKALAAQGFNPAVAQPPLQPSPTSPTPESSTRSSSPVESVSSVESPPAPASVKTEQASLPSTSFPLSPAPSHSSLDFDSSPSPLFSGPSSPSLPSIKPHPPDEPPSAVDEAAMEVLLREILATSPSIESHNLPPLGTSTFQKTSSTTPSSQAEMNDAPMDEVVKFDVDGEALGLVTRADQLEALGNSWVNGVDMHRMLESMLPTISSTAEEPMLPELELGWDLEAFASNTGMVGINAF
ncbi:hypothetical protein APHAL10511_006931 [Amanita phalloides]|nr:hypothetical protein APHAL10511_006931 [Amanita phalloides]